MAEEGWLGALVHGQSNEPNRVICWPGAVLRVGKDKNVCVWVPTMGEREVGGHNRWTEAGDTVSDRGDAKDDHEAGADDDNSRKQVTAGSR